MFEPAYVWQKWFAWRPVICKNALHGVAWLEFVWRKRDISGRRLYYVDPESPQRPRTNGPRGSGEAMRIDRREILIWAIAVAILAVLAFSFLAAETDGDVEHEHQGRPYL
jgi:hypothetical protein